MISTRRLARILLYVGLLYSKVGAQELAPFLTESIYQIGGLLKIEVRNYLSTKAKYNEDFRVVCPLVEDSQQVEQSIQRYKRDLTKDDIEFFESEAGFMSYTAFFINILTKGREGSIKPNEFNSYLDFVTTGNLEGQEEKYCRFQVSHYILNWLFDLMQFCFQYLVKGDKIGMIKHEVEGEEETKINIDPTSQLTVEDDF